MTRWAKRVDANQQTIMAAFRKLGCWVGDLHGIGQGMPDLLLSVPPSHVLVLVEVKDGKKSPSRRKLTKPEEDFHASCPAMIWVIENLDQVQNLVRFYRHG